MPGPVFTFDCTRSLQDTRDLYPISASTCLGPSATRLGGRLSPWSATLVCGNIDDNSLVSVDPFFLQRVFAQQASLRMQCLAGNTLWTHDILAAVGDIPLVFAVGHNNPPAIPSDLQTVYDRGMARAASQLPGLFSSPHSKLVPIALL